MGHITVDRLDDAWKFLGKAEHFVGKGHTHSAVLYCEKALDELHRSADGMGYGVWFSGKAADVRDDLGQLKFETEPEAESVEGLIEECYELVQRCAEKVIPELHSRIDYNPTPSRFEVSV